MKQFLDHAQRVFRLGTVSFYWLSLPLAVQRRRMPGFRGFTSATFS